MDRDLVQARTVDHEGSIDVHLREGAREDGDEVGVVDADDLRVRARWVRQRPEDVEDGPHAEFLAWPDDRLHRGVEHRGEHESDADVLDVALDRGRFGVDRHTDLFEDVGTARGRGDGVVAVLRDRDPSPSHDDRARRRDVDRVVVVAARPTGVDERPAVGRDCSRGRTHALCEARYLRLCLALGSEARQQRPDLGLSRVLEHDRGGVAGLLECQICSLRHAFDVVLHVESPMYYFGL